MENVADLLLLRAWLPREISDCAFERSYVTIAMYVPRAKFELNSWPKRTLFSQSPCIPVRNAVVITRAFNIYSCDVQKALKFY